MASPAKDQLLEAVSNGDLGAVEQLLKSFSQSPKGKKRRKVDYYLTQQEKLDLLVTAVSKKRLEIVKLFIASSLNFTSHKFVKSPKTTPLHVAIENDDVEMFKLLLANGADVRSMDQDERTPLCLAAKLGKIELVKVILEPYKNQILERKQVIDHKGKHGTALHEAIINDRMEIVKLLLEDYKCDPQGLEVAVKEGKINVLDNYIVERSISAEQKLDRIEWLFYQAVLAGQINIVEHLLKTRQVDINKDDKENNYALETAIKSSNEKMVDYLLQQGAFCGNGSVLCTAVQHNKTKLLNKFLEMNVLNVNAVSPKHDWATPLNLAATHQRKEQLEILLEYKAKVNYKGGDGLTPLHCAVESESTEIAKILLDHGASVNALNGASNMSSDSTRITPLHIAVRCENFKMVKLLLEYKADVTIESDSMTTPLEWAACYGYQAIAELLLDKGVFHGDSRQRIMLSAIHSAVEQNKLEMVELLLNSGVSLKSNDETRTPLLHVAAERGYLQIFKALLPAVLANDGDVNDGFGYESVTALHRVVWSQCTGNEEKREEIIELLLANGADINAKDIHGLTPLHFAISSGHIKRAVFLIRKGADFNFKNVTGFSIIDFCNYYKSIVEAKELVKEIVWRVNIENADLNQYLLRKIKADDNLKKLYDLCVRETQKLKKEKFSKTGVTLVDIMRTKNVNRLVSYTRNQNIVDYLEAGYYRLKFIIYGQTIQEHFAPAILRRDLLDHQNVKNFFNFLLDKNGTRLPSLPATFTNEVFTHLTNEDLESLKETARFVKV